MTAAGKIQGQQTREQDLRSFLGTFNFGGDMVKQAVGSMSGGEKARLVLCMIVWQRPNLLLLDEPTNHLDLATREALSMALNEFEGTVMLVSHDRALLRAVCDEFWMVSRGGVAPFDGDLDDYQRYLLDEAKRQREAIKEAASGAAKAASQALKAESAAHTADEQSKAQQRRMDAGKHSGKEGKRDGSNLTSTSGAKSQTGNIKPKSAKRELELVDARMTVLNGEGAALEVRLADSPTPTEIADLGKRLKLVNDELQGLEEKWLSLSSEMESASA